MSDLRRASPEWYANRAAEVILTRAGPLFWAALVAAVIAASLGWQFQ